MRIPSLGITTNPVITTNVDITHYIRIRLGTHHTSLAQRPQTGQDNGSTILEHIKQNVVGDASPGSRHDHRAQA